MSVPTTYWYDRILPHCPGLDETMFGVALHKVMRDYFRDSYAWGDDLTVPGGEGDDTFDLDEQYTIPADTYKRVGQIWEVWMNDRPVPPLTREYFNLRYHENLGFYWYADQPNVLKFSAPLSAATTFMVQVSVLPSDGLTEVPDFVADHHDDAIEAGLLAYFLAMPAKPWTNGQLALYHKTEYRERVGEARAVAERAYTPADAQWTYPRSFA